MWLVQNTVLLQFCSFARLIRWNKASRRAVRVIKPNLRLIWARWKTRSWRNMGKLSENSEQGSRASVSNLGRKKKAYKNNYLKISKISLKSYFHIFWGTFAASFVCFPSSFWFKLLLMVSKDQHEYMKTINVNNSNCLYISGTAVSSET